MLGLRGFFRLGLFLVFALALLFGTKSAVSAQDSFYLARILSVEEMEKEYSGYGEVDYERIHFVILRGEKKNYAGGLVNVITHQPYYDMNVEVGNRVLLEYQDGEYYLVDFARGPALFVITGLFMLVMLGVGGVKGLKTLVSLVIMAVVILFVLLPLILKGVQPILATVGISFLLTLLFLFLVGGWNKKTFAALGGTMGGLLFAGLLAVFVGEMGYLTGLSSHEAQMLQFYDASLNLKGLLFAGMIIGALGAVLDVAMSISSSQEQIKRIQPDVSWNQLVKGGLHVGRDMLGTMANTLILAYLGTSLPLLLLFSVYEASYATIMNLDLMATEVVRALSGSIGLALAIPLTAVLGGFLHSKKG